MLLISVIGLGITGTCIDFTPRYKVYERFPKAVLTNNDNNGVKFTLIQVIWPTSSPKCDVARSTDISLCGNSPIYKDVSFYKNLSHHLSCPNVNGTSVNINSLDLSLFNFPLKNTLTIEDVAINGSYCKLSFDALVNVSKDDLSCNITSNKIVETCLNHEGSHIATMATYLLLRTSWSVFELNIYSLLDGTSMHLANKHDGDFAWILVGNTLSGVLAPMMYGALIKDSTDPSSKNHLYI